MKRAGELHRQSGTRPRDNAVVLQCKCTVSLETGRGRWSAGTGGRQRRMLMTGRRCRWNVARGLNSRSAAQKAVAVPDC